jgi:formamidopyrimidine-DNA glycosylase
VLGKELFLIFGSVADHERSHSADAGPPHESALRLHFGMSGSLRLEAAPRFAGPKLSVRLDFDALVGGSGSSENVGGVISCFDTSVSSVDAAATRAKVAASQHLDVCSAHFNARQAATQLKARATHKLLADALLDQAVLPGSGNIIKNEALARAQLDPRRRVRTLSFREVDLVVAEVRAYSTGWLRQHPSKPPKLVYDRTACGTCGGPVALAKLGEDSLRPTFWCAACLATAAARFDEPRSSFAPSESPRVPQTSASASSVSGASAAAPSPQLASHPSAPPSAAPLRAWLGLSATPSVPSAPLVAASGGRKRAPSEGEAIVEGQLPPTPRALQARGLNKQPRSAFGATCMAVPTALPGASEAAHAAAPGAAFYCRVHGAGPSMLKRVRKEGPNVQRLFFGCRARASSRSSASAGNRGPTAPGSCAHFAWADSHFPLCKCAEPPSCSVGPREMGAAAQRGAPLARLRVSKKEASGGRWFFGCGQRSCDFFAWASPAQLAPLGKSLTPLL